MKFYLHNINFEEPTEINIPVWQSLGGAILVAVVCFSLLILLG